MTSKPKPIQTLDWKHFEEHLKAEVPWLVYDKQIKEGSYQVKKNQTKVNVSDLQEWRDQNLICFIYAGDKQDKLYCIFLKHQFDKKDDIDNQAKLVPQKFRKDIIKGNQNDTQTNSKQETIAIGLQSVIRRPQAQKIEKKKDQQEQNKKQETEQEIRLVNSFVLVNDPALKQRFTEIYTQFDRENK